MGQETYHQNLETITRSHVGAADATHQVVPGLTILAHPDVQRIGERVDLPALSSGQEVLLSRAEETLFGPPAGGERRGLGDPHLSRSPLKLQPLDGGGIRLDLSATRTRITVGDGASISGQRDFTAAEIERGIVLVLAGRVTLLLHTLDPASLEGPSFGLVGDSAAMVALRSEIGRVADTEVTVLLRGATGTGKELVAQGIHRASPRRDRPFVAVNMGALPPSLAAVELFGAVKGAYTGADRRRDGYFVRAQGGTLFLDEIGETPPEIQVMLLRTLQDRVVQPVGTESTQEVDVRIIAATDADLEAEIEAGRFRAPLLYRLLAGYEIRLPPLNARRDDVGRLLVHFFREELEALGESWRLEQHGGKDPWLPAHLVAKLAEHEWPGNVRQLKSIARQLVIAHRGEPCLRLTPRIEEMLGPLSPATASPPVPPEMASAAAVPAPAPREPSAPSMAAPQGSGAEKGVLRTLLMIELMEKPRLATRLGERRALDVISQHDRQVRALLPEYDGYEVDKSDGFLLLFERPADAVGFALEYHEATRELSEEIGEEMATRAAIYLGEVFLRHNSPEEVSRGAKPFEVEGFMKPVVARLVALAAGHQTLLTRGAFDLAHEAASGDHPLADPAVRWHRHGEYRLEGVEKVSPPRGDKVVEVCEVGVEGTAPFTEPRSHRAAVGQGEATSTARPSEIDDVEILRVLKEHDFRIQATAKALGIPRTSLNRLIDKSKRIRKPGALSREEIEDARQRHGGDRTAMAEALEVSRKGLSRRMTELGLE